MLFVSAEDTYRQRAATSLPHNLWCWSRGAVFCWLSCLLVRRGVYTQPLFCLGHPRLHAGFLSFPEAGPNRDERDFHDFLGLSFDWLFVAIGSMTVCCLQNCTAGLFHVACGALYVVRVRFGDPGCNYVSVCSGVLQFGALVVENERWFSSVDSHRLRLVAVPVLHGLLSPCYDLKRSLIRLLERSSYCISLDEYVLAGGEILGDVHRMVSVVRCCDWSHLSEHLLQLLYER